MEVRKAVLGPDLSPFGSLARMALVCFMWREVSIGIWCWAVMKVLHLKMFSSHRGVRCLRSLLE